MPLYSDYLDALKQRNPGVDPRVLGGAADYLTRGFTTPKVASLFPGVKLAGIVDRHSLPKTDTYYIRSPREAAVAAQQFLRAHAGVPPLTVVPFPVVPLPGMPPIPHPEASNLDLGPNLGGADAVAFPWEGSVGAGGGGGNGGGAGGIGGLFLLAGLGVLLVFVLRK